MWDIFKHCLMLTAFTARTRGTSPKCALRRGVEVTSLICCFGRRFSLGTSQNLAEPGRSGTYSLYKAGGHIDLAAISCKTDKTHSAYKLSEASSGRELPSPLSTEWNCYSIFSG